MKNTTHTPGPWKVKKIYAPFNNPNGTGQARYFAIEHRTETRHALPAYLVAPCEIHPVGEKPIPNKEGKANARLIAAAPDMFQALQCVVDLLGDQEGIFIEQCKAALAKAKGEE